MKLYEINEQLISIIRDGEDLVDMSTGELIDERDFENLQMERADKLEGLCLYYKDLTAEAAAIKAEEKSLRARREATENKAERLKAFLQGQLAGEKLSTPRVKVSYRKSKSTEVTDIELLPTAFLRYKDPEPDKTAIAEALDRGIVVPGAKRVEKTSMTIK